MEVLQILKCMAGGNVEADDDDDDDGDGGDDDDDVDHDVGDDDMERYFIFELCTCKNGCILARYCRTCTSCSEVKSAMAH